LSQDNPPEIDDRLIEAYVFLLEESPTGGKFQEKVLSFIGSCVESLSADVDKIIVSGDLN
jgi:hypothetical protein